MGEWWGVGLYGFAGGVVAGLVVYSILAFKLFRLQFHVAGLQQALLTLRNTTAVNKRWSKDQALEAEILASARAPERKTDRYANDPIPWDSSVT